MLDGVKKAVMFAAHSDDEMICAGTLHRLAQQGCDVSVVAFSPAATKGDRVGANSSINIVHTEFDRSMNLIGSTGIFVGLTPSAELERHRQRICQFVYDYCEMNRPDLAFILSPRDENTAHAVVGIECERVMRGRVPLVVRCQFPWNIDVGHANLFVTLSPEDLDVKRSVIQAYKSQHWRYEYERILMAAVVADGESVKVRAAEKFELLRGVI